MQAYEFLDGIALADVAFRATGETVDELFDAAADALLAAMVGDPASVRPARRETLALAAPELDRLLFAFLNELVFRKDARRLFLRPTGLRTSQTGGGWRAEAELAGEPIARGRHALRADVKAVTLHRFEIRQTDAGWEATVVLDV